MKAVDLTGKRFNMLTVTGKGDGLISGKQRKTTWICRCDCGNTIECVTQKLIIGEKYSCGCVKKPRKSKLEDLTGQRFSRLVVLERAETTNVSTRWKCKCDCGKECIVLAENLKTGHTKSCGCYRDETRIKNKTKHGFHHTRIYSVYEKVKQRCCNPNNPSYHRYGGRGITICEEWKDNPEAFIKWAYENGYKEDAEYGECTIERIDNNRGYSPDNCKIANEKQQANNRRTNLLITHNGETKTLAQWRDYFGMTQSKAYYHLVEKKRTIQYLIDNGIV